MNHNSFYCLKCILLLLNIITTTVGVKYKLLWYYLNFILKEKMKNEKNALPLTNSLKSGVYARPNFCKTHTSIKLPPRYAQGERNLQ